MIQCAQQKNIESCTMICHSEISGISSYFNWILIFGAPPVLPHPQQSRTFLTYLVDHWFRACFPIPYQPSRLQESDQVVFAVVPTWTLRHNQHNSNWW